MKTKTLLPLTVAACLVIAPAMAIGGTRAAADSAPGVGATNYTADVMRLCAKIGATGANVQDDACDQAPSTHMADDVERLCSKIDLFNLEITDPACDDGAAAAYVPNAAGPVGGLGGAALIVPAAATVGIGTAFAASGGNGNGGPSGGTN